LSSYFFCTGGFLLQSFSGGISGQSSGGCTCHGTASSNTLVTISGLPSGGYTNGNTYTLTVTVSNNSLQASTGGFGLRSGFDLSATAGSFTATTGTQLNTATEILHDAALVATNGNASWTFTWTAPLTGNTPILFDVSGNATDGSGDPSGDEWNQTSITLNHGGSSGNTTLQLQCFIQGYWDGISGMTSVLANQGETSAANACDTILVKLHHSVTNAVVASQKALLMQNGSCNVVFNSNLSGSYYISLHHRNAIETWSANPVLFSSVTNYNFTSANSQSYGSNMVEVASNVWALYAGDIVKDASEAADLADIAQLETDNTNFAYGFQASDINGDGTVDLSDFPLAEMNVNSFVFANHP
jgi:hypothetical protein